MTGELTLGRRRADEARYELSHALFGVNRPGVEPDDAARALKAAIVRAIAKLEEADKLLDSGTLEAVGYYGHARDLEVQLAFEKGGTEAANKLIDSRFAPRSPGPVPTDGDELDTQAEFAALGPATVQLRTGQPTDAEIDAMAVEGAVEDTFGVDPADLVNFAEMPGGKGVGA